MIEMIDRRNRQSPMINLYIIPKQQLIQTKETEIKIYTGNNKFSLIHHNHNHVIGNFHLKSIRSAAVVYRINNKILPIKYEPEI